MAPLRGRRTRALPRRARTKRAVAPQPRPQAAQRIEDEPDVQLASTVLETETSDHTEEEVVVCPRALDLSRGERDLSGISADDDTMISKHFAGSSMASAPTPRRRSATSVSSRASAAMTAPAQAAFTQSSVAAPSTVGLGRRARFRRCRCRRRRPRALDRSGRAQCADVRLRPRSAPRALLPWPRHSRRRSRRSGASEQRDAERLYELSRPSSANAGCQTGPWSAMADAKAS